MYRGATSFGAVVVVLALTALSLPAHAQGTAEVGKADALFNAGRSLLEAGEYVDACPKFAEAQTLAPGLGVTLYLADCYERIGHTASALVEFRRAEQIALTRNDKRGGIAHDRAVTLEAEVPQLALVVMDGARAQEVVVTRDGEPVPPSQWDVPLPMDPGEHEIVVSAPSKVTRRTVVTLEPVKETVTIKIEALDDAPVPPPPSSPSAPIVDVTLPMFREAPQTRKIVGLFVGGVGILGVGIGSVLGILASSKLRQSNEGPCDVADHCSPEGMDLRMEADHFANASTGVFIVAGAALVGGVVLYFAAPKTSRTVQGLVLDPLLSSQVAALRARSTF
jgi:serine/threonine-protein kinase